MYICCHSVVQLCPTLWDPMDCSMSHFTVLDYHAHWIDAVVYFAWGCFGFSAIPQWCPQTLLLILQWRKFKKDQRDEELRLESETPHTQARVFRKRIEWGKWKMWRIWLLSPSIKKFPKVPTLGSPYATSPKGQAQLSVNSRAGLKDQPSGERLSILMMWFAYA